MRLSDLDDLPASLDTPAAADLFGVSTDLLYDLARKGEAPIEPLRLGRVLRWPTVRVLAALGIEREAGSPSTGDPRSLTLVDHPR